MLIDRDEMVCTISRSLNINVNMYNNFSPDFVNKMYSTKGVKTHEYFNYYTLIFINFGCESRFILERISILFIKLKM